MIWRTESLQSETKWGEGWKMGVREGLWGGTANTEGRLRVMWDPTTAETSNNIYICERNRVTKQQPPAPEVICHQEMSPVWGMGYILFSHWPKGPRENPNPKHLRLLPRLLVALYNLMVRPYYGRHHLCILVDIEKLSWCLIRAFAPTA